MEIKNTLRSVSAANHFTSRFSGFGQGWRPWAEDSLGCLLQSCAFQNLDLEQEDFGWLQSPVKNRLTRLAAITDAATGRLMVQGYERRGGGDRIVQPSG